ncbi:hypothetical protein LPJ56_001740 [Coemansia sp. RSA 2599]|nr:hypothetical protein LPJ56_001740 [Coemansia sp. RSA 2599]
MSALATQNIGGTGAGTGIKAATDVAKESGLTEAGGYPLIADWNDSRYIGHGVAHRDPKTGEPVPANVHIPADGELNPQNYINTIMVEEDPEEARQRTRDAFLLKYNKKKASDYRANMYKLAGSIQSKLGNKEAGAKKLERAKLEREAYHVDHSEIHFRKDKSRARH